MFIGGYFLRFLGTIVLYLYGNVLSLIRTQKFVSFKEVWSTPNNNEFYGSVSAELLQKMLGIGVIIF